MSPARFWTKSASVGFASGLIVNRSGDDTLESQAARRIARWRSASDQNFPFSRSIAAISRVAASRRGSRASSAFRRS